MSDQSTLCACHGGSTHGTDNPAIRRCDLCGGIVRTDPVAGEYVQSTAGPFDTTTPDVVQIAGRTFTIEHLRLDGPDRPPFYGCGMLPLRANREDLIADITRAQGPEWRR